ncbi:MAG: ATP-binding cassette domain-containing protein [Gammaproteobacteria bacterium]|nr:ATP-binding cassette domain-containing protein [Gammaproteobacteria bacterium]
MSQVGSEAGQGSPMSIEQRHIVLQVQGLSKRFADKTVLEDITFDIRQGESVALIGSNGVGKSTALYCCLRLIEPENGRIQLLDQNLLGVKAKSLRMVRREVGFIFQKHNLVPRACALTNVLHGALGYQSGPRQWLHCLTKSKNRKRAYEMLERVGLNHIALQRADKLSGGQSQRVAIARALMQNPKIIMADEPVASLDPIAGEAIMQLFFSLCKSDGITLLFTSHNIEHALQYSDRVLAIAGGKITLDACSAELDAADLNQQYHYG